METNPIDSFQDDDLRNCARQCLAFLDLLYEIDGLPDIYSVPLGTKFTEQLKTLDLLKRLRASSITFEIKSLLGILREGRSPVEKLVVRARYLDTSWAQIGEALGMTQQGAHKAFADLRPLLFDKGLDNI